MNIAQKIYCRIFQGAFRIAMPFMPYREPVCLDSLIKIPEVLSEKKVTSVLLVTDEFLSGTEGFKQLSNALEANKINCVVYNKTCPNPTVHNVEEARTLYVNGNCQAIIAFGGGSPMDCAKGVGARIAYPKKPMSKLKGLLKVLKKIPTLVAVPTTAGTGSEVTLTAVITDSEKKHKYTMNDFTLIPSYAVLDPAVTYSLPPSLTATTGMDALTHAVEAYIGGSTTKETRRCALEATELIFKNIETAYNDGTNHIARKNMLEAAYKAGIAFSKSYVGYIHAVAHSLGGQYNVPHGFANSVLMPIVLEEYGETAYKKLHQLAVIAGVASESDSDAEGAKKFIDAIKELNSRMGIPETISGIKKEDIPLMAAHADKEANPLYPVPKLMNAKKLEKFYYAVADWSND
ncbi:MAG: iron-containing alcohol dehydrogenase [Oscillospiraceae bacterium]|nr:iron-containing alcohol dehydrogenase [Oscillospiraceae bacterium]